jgi:hypothetical protein
MSVPRPVLAMARDLPPAHEIDWHSHPRFQLVYAARGVLVVDTRDATWVVPPQSAVWVPPATEHRLTAKGPVQLRSLYVRTDAAARMPGSCVVLEVTPLLRELILRATQLPLEYEVRGRRAGSSVCCSMSSPASRACPTACRCRRRRRLRLSAGSCSTRRASP